MGVGLALAAGADGPGPGHARILHPGPFEMTIQASLAGQVLTGVPLADLADAFRRAGLDAHYHRNPGGHEEVRVNGAGDADCLLERGDPGEYLVCDAGGERGAVQDMARTLSAVLTGMGVRHRLELLNEDDREMFAYLHHGWPLS